MTDNMSAAVSADGTVIAFSAWGEGEPLIIIDGATAYPAINPTNEEVGRLLSDRFRTYAYDRRGRGQSTDTAPYAVEREIEDLAAVIAEAGGQAAVFGGSSGAGLALRAAVRNPAITRLALWEPPYHVDDSAPPLPGDFAEQLDRLVEAGRQADAVELFLVRAMQVSSRDVAGMRGHASWPAMEAAARSLVYEARVMGPGNALPAELLAGITQPALVLNGGASPAWMRRAGQAVADAIPGAVYRVLEGQSHSVAPTAIVPELLEFLIRS